jgi:DNA-binding response OmpR family regulator
MNSQPILLVEDDPAEAARTRRALSQRGIANSVVVAVDGQDALALLLPPPGRAALTPAVVLLDLHLPTVDGVQVLRAVRATARTAALPVIVLVDSLTPRDLISVHQLGTGLGYAYKPVTFDELHRAADQMGLGWHLLSLPNASALR